MDGYSLKPCASSLPEIYRACKTFLTKKTVENHITNIGKKLKINGVGRLRKWILKSKS